MLNPRQMSKLVVLGPVSQIEKTTALLYSLQVLHITEHKKTQELDIGAPLERASKIAELLVKIRSISTLLGIKPQLTTFESTTKFNLKDIEKQCKEFSEKASFLMELTKNHELLKKEAQEKKEILHNLSLLHLELDLLSSYDTLGFAVGFVKNTEEVTQGLSHVKARYELTTATNESGKALLALFFDKKQERELRAVLDQHGFTPFDLSKCTTLKGTVAQNKKQAEDQIAQAEKKHKQVLLDIKKLGVEWSPTLTLWESYLTKEAQIAEAPLRFGFTEQAFVITGWVPDSRVKTTVDRLEKESKKKLYITLEKPGEKDAVPIELENPKMVKPFEFFMHLYTLPNFREIDPTFFIFLSFPLLFGFMLGDMGYGLVTLLLFYALKKKMPQFSGFFNVLIFSSFATIFFGAVFGEFFGLEEIGEFHIPHLLSRAHQIDLLLYIAIAVGVLHVTLGLFIGFYNELSHHGFFHAFCAKLSWVVLLLGVAMLGVSYANYSSLPVIVGYIVIGLSIMLLGMGEGVNGLVEIPGIFGNILSYARLMAIGMASVGLAVVVNGFAEKFFEEGDFMIVVAVLTLLVGHVINIALGIIGPFLHSLRLHYVEFFTKFYKGGGRPYKPFGLGESKQSSS